MRRQVDLSLNFALWCFRVMEASFLAVIFTRSSSVSWRAVGALDCVCSVVVYLSGSRYVLVMLLLSRLAVASFICSRTRLLVL